MRPRTLLGRLLLVLIVGTALAHLATSSLAQRSSPVRWVQEQPPSVHVLKSMQPAERSVTLVALMQEAPLLMGARLDEWASTAAAQMPAPEPFELTTQPVIAPWHLTGIGIPLLLALLACGIVVIARQMTSPLARLARAADELGRDFRRPPIPEEGPAEARRLARAFNTLRERLISYVEERTRILAAMSHDLRTPLTRLRLRAEAIPSAEQRVRFEQDLAEMQTLVESTLDLLRGVGRAEPVAFTDLGEMLEELQAEFVELGHDVVIDCKGSLTLRSRRVAVKRCVRNLLENALKFGTRASVTAVDAGSEVVVRVDDDGPGIPVEDREAIFQPFHRLEYSRSRETGGLGLGLSIAREIVHLHRGTLTVSDAPQGGARFELRLPATVQSAGVCCGTSRRL